MAVFCWMQGMVVNELKAQIAAETDSAAKGTLEKRLQLEVKKLKAVKEAAAAEQEQCASPNLAMLSCSLR
jgi:uncharacterized coiled-coil protein SlyX